MTTFDKIVKRVFDLFVSTSGLILFSPVILFAFIIATFETRRNGFFLQKRVGKNGKLFTVIKIRTMKDSKVFKTNVTTDKDPRITKSGRFFRKTKIDELPQLINIVIGNMSFVGPRPDVPGFADKLSGNDRIILTIRPGITGPATIYFRNEEDMLAKQTDPEEYNRLVIWPQKIELNKDYIINYSFSKDISYIFKTIF